MRRILAALLALALAAPVSAAEFRWATTGDPSTLDPHAQNTAPVLGFLNNIYEGLMRRNSAMKLEPALATAWEALGGDGWRFHLRQGVTFQDGAAFDADDVLFSYRRASSPQADTASWFASVRDVVVVDPYTIDFLTEAPNPIFPDSITNFMILDRGWAERNDAMLPNRETGNYATLNANGTGPFRVTLREPGLQTVLEPFAAWWDKPTHNITRAIHKPIKNPATALASLISGAVDFIEPVPIQDVERLRTTSGVKVIEGVEARVIMLGFSHAAPTLRLDGAPNPFSDPRVRRAVALAVNVDAITSVIMRGTAEPVSQIIDPASRGFSTVHAARWPFDPPAARALLAEAGYPDGFAFALRCPNDRYINDEAVCQAVVGMLAKIGLTANLEAMPVAGYFQRLREGDFDMYLLGWSPGSFDAEHPIRFLAATPDDAARLGSWNFGGFSDPRIDALLPEIQTEIDEAARQKLLDEAAGILQAQVAYVPLYVQPLLWGVRENVNLVQRPDDFFILRWVRVN
jgi:peptide/nickel transport system substrate-binding protein